MQTRDFDFELPEHLIAQNPTSNRTDARLMVLHRKSETLEHRFIRDLPAILNGEERHPGYVLVFNETQVFPARLNGRIEDKSVEVFLHRKTAHASQWECLVKPGKRFRKGAKIHFDQELIAEVLQIQEDGTRILEFSKGGEAFDQLIDRIGETPLPPYIKSSTAPPERYQTVYAKTRGSVAAPTAGLHFTKELLKKLKENGTEIQNVTLHVGRGTFEPVKSDDLSEHVMHHEWFNLSPETADALNRAKAAEKRILAVGTTSTRVLESCSHNGRLVPGSGDTNLFITPGYQFKFIDGLLTNFHLPKSTLIMLVSALAGREFVLHAYQKAIEKEYRFYSFGDAMLVL